MNTLWVLFLTSLLVGEGWSKKVFAQSDDHKKVVVDKTHSTTKKQSDKVKTDTAHEKVTHDKADEQKHKVDTTKATAPKKQTKQNKVDHKQVKADDKKIEKHKTSDDAKKTDQSKTGHISDEKKAVDKAKEKTSDDSKEKITTDEKKSDTNKVSEKTPVVPKEITTDDVLEVGLDTVSAESGGNWLNKRVWYEHSQQIIAQINRQHTDIMKIRKDYISVREKLDATIKNAFAEIEIDQSQLEDLLDHFTDLLEVQEHERGDLSAPERALLRKLKVQKKNLEQLQLDVQAVKNLDDSMDEAMKRMMDQINLAGTYAKEADQNFEQIPSVNEKRARHLYYKIDTFYQDLLSIKSYLTGQLFEFVHQLQNNAHMHIAKIKSQMAAISAKGIDFKKEIALFEKEDAPIIQERHEDEEDDDEDEPGFFGKIWEWITGWF